MNTAVTKDTELSYLVHPHLVETDLDYPATHIAVDLAFTDGTYLSGLKATDSHGGLLPPQGLGDAKRRGEYAIGSPLFTKTTVRMDNGRELVVKAPKNSAKNIYVQGVKVDGEKWASTALPHDVLAEGGTLEFDMGPKPSAWGTGKDAAPVSVQQDDRAPAPRGDVLKGDGALFDDTSGHLGGGHVRGTAGRLRHGDGGAPVHADVGGGGQGAGGLTLQGSPDGKKWRDIDRRSGQSFAWDRQTRAFSVDRPGAYATYRLVLTGPATPAEVELLS